MKKLGWLMILLFLAGCSSNESLSPAQSALQGKWQLTEFCLSPGDTSCPVQTATPATTQVLDFRADGTFLENRPQPGQSQAPIFSSGEYRLEAPDVIYFKFDPVVTSGFNGVIPPKVVEEVKWHYSLTGNLLILNPPCKERCAYTYKKI
ncbi:hypothetical protein [Persicitalea jodogahamensis]|uniref:Lipocalin-like domain-containing protein n=1 Tax=Persicitalea jodogahamensis TaxID=402147 RepID=A0A8J3G906_9BACT|nr:hypothetical protein [Persicitalea jodogahamensis]GHB62781.1 hypothetical protein GCM10007390_15770 [Persicitalea jodogahamensis]